MSSIAAEAAAVVWHSVLAEMHGLSRGCFCELPAQTSRKDITECEAQKQYMLSI
jgi:uncharacterized protein VirK/YbjX